MVSTIHITEQKRLQKKRGRASLVKQLRNWKAYQLKERDFNRRDRAYFTIQLNAKLKAVKKQAALSQLERIRKKQAAQTELLRVQTVAQAQRLEKYKKQVGSERAKAQAAVASRLQKWKNELAQRASAYNKRLRAKEVQYKKPKVTEEKRITGYAKKAEQWETWWSRLPVEKRRSMIRVTRTKQHGSTVWVPRLHG